MGLENSGMGLLSIVMGGLTGLSKFLGNIWKALTSQSAKNVGVLKSLNSQSSVSDINRITEIFESYKEKVGEE